MLLMVKNIKNGSALRNHNYVSLGIIHTVFCGDQTAKTVEESGIRVQQLIESAQKREKPVLILSDISKIGKINLGARKIGLNLISGLDYQKLAIVGVSFLTQQLVKTVVTASGRAFKIKTFDTQSEAKKWLLSKNI